MLKRVLTCEEDGVLYYNIQDEELGKPALTVKEMLLPENVDYKNKHIQFIDGNGNIAYMYVKEQINTEYPDLTKVIKLNGTYLSGIDNMKNGNYSQAQYLLNYALVFDSENKDKLKEVKIISNDEFNEAFKKLFFQIKSNLE
jgi:hypothetical protein